ncbi:hypothetical protein PENSTE_c020G07260 [Penicillium steckii]|uniref:Uncharacterized protein n=1 Tax=Penicillium steckii TaxID=303698 RepID=A0A1V6SU38_9EURO|nr:hypothetical protein PENSTE_c020G07260 [Penicillium steckii]
MSDLDNRLDEQIQQMRQNIEALRKRRQLIELQAQFEKENRLLEEAQRQLEAARAPSKSNSLCQDSTEHDWQGVAVATQTQTPSKPSTTPNGVSGLVSPTMHLNGGLTIKGSAKTNPVDQFMTSLQNDMGRSEAARDMANQPPQHGETQVNGRSNSQSGLPPLDPAPPLTIGQRSQAQMTQETRRPSGPTAPVQHIEERTLTVKHPDPAPRPSDASEDLSEDMDESSNEGSTNDEGSGSDEKMDQSSSPLAPPLTPTEPIRTKPNGLSYRDGRGPAHPSPSIKIPMYEARSMRECTNLIDDLEKHFSNYPKFYSAEDHKVQMGENYLDSRLFGDWNARRRTLSRPSWTAFCIFLAEQLSDLTPRLIALERYDGSNQMPGQSCMGFAMYLAQYAPHANRMDNRSLHFWGHMDRRLKGLAGRNWRDFGNFWDFLDFLIDVERKRGGPTSLSRSGGRKRLRADS